MSVQSRLPTRVAGLTNVVVLVGGPEPLATRARAAAVAASAAHLYETGVASLATVCAEVRPYAIIIPNDLYEFGGDEFDALARDVNAGLVVVPAGVQQGVLSALLSEEAARLG